MATKIQIRRGLKEDLPVLSIGEFGFCTDTDEIFLGTVDGNIAVNAKVIEQNDVNTDSLIPKVVTGKFLRQLRDAATNAAVDTTYNTITADDIAGSNTTPKVITGKILRDLKDGIAVPSYETMAATDITSKTTTAKLVTGKVLSDLKDSVPNTTYEIMTSNDITNETEAAKVVTGKFLKTLISTGGGGSDPTIVTDGDGTLFLSDDGTYKLVDGGSGRILTEEDLVGINEVLVDLSSAINQFDGSDGGNYELHILLSDPINEGLINKVDILLSLLNDGKVYTSNGNDVVITGDESSFEVVQYTKNGNVIDNFVGCLIVEKNINFQGTADAHRISWYTEGLTAPTIEDLILSNLKEGILKSITMEDLNNLSQEPKLVTGKLLKDLQGSGGGSTGDVNIDNYSSYVPRSSFTIENNNVTNVVLNNEKNIIFPEGVISIGSYINGAPIILFEASSLEVDYVDTNVENTNIYYSGYNVNQLYEFLTSGAVENGLYYQINGQRLKLTIDNGIYIFGENNYSGEYAYGLVVGELRYLNSELHYLNSDKLSLVTNLSIGDTIVIKNVKMQEEPIGELIATTSGNNVKDYASWEIDYVNISVQQYDFDPLQFANPQVYQFEHFEGDKFIINGEILEFKGQRNATQYTGEYEMEWVHNGDYETDELGEPDYGRPIKEEQQGDEIVINIDFSLFGWIPEESYSYEIEKFMGMAYNVDDNRLMVISNYDLYLDNVSTPYGLNIYELPPLEQGVLFRGQLRTTGVVDYDFESTPIASKFMGRLPDGLVDYLKNETPGLYTYMFNEKPYKYIGYKEHYGAEVYNFGQDATDPGFDDGFAIKYTQGMPLMLIHKHNVSHLMIYVLDAYVSSEDDDYEDTQGGGLIEDANFRNIDFPKTLNYIGYQAFYNSSYSPTTEKLDFPERVRRIGESAFFGFSNLKGIIMNPKIPPILGHNALQDQTCYIFVPDDSLDRYLYDDNFSQYANRIKPISEKYIFWGKKFQKEAEAT